jgi:hypothetical protein
MELYKGLLEQYKNRDLFLRRCFSKKEKDILLLVLQKAQPDTERKMLRRRVLDDVKVIQKKSYEEFREASIR